MQYSINTVHASIPWFQGCITKYYGQGEGYNQEHGNDVGCFAYGTPITALLSGTVSFAGYTSFGFYEVTWKLDNPAQAKNSPYAYAEDLSREIVHINEHISQGQIIGYSVQWVEFGLTPDYAYGVSGWHWGINSIFLIQLAKGNMLPSPVPTITVNEPLKKIESYGEVKQPLNKKQIEHYYLSFGIRWYTICEKNRYIDCNTNQLRSTLTL